MLHHKSCEVEKEIEDDRRIVEELKNLLRFESDEISDIFSEAEIHHDKLIHQKYLETQSRWRAVYKWRHKFGFFLGPLICRVHTKLGWITRPAITICLITRLTTQKWAIVKVLETRLEVELLQFNLSILLLDYNLA